MITWWKTKTPENVIKGYKVNLQHALGTWVPNGVLNFLFKHSYSRKVSVPEKNILSNYMVQLFFFFFCYRD